MDECASSLRKFVHRTRMDQSHGLRAKGKAKRSLHDSMARSSRENQNLCQKILEGCLVFVDVRGEKHSMKSSTSTTKTLLDLHLQQLFS